MSAFGLAKTPIVVQLPLQRLADQADGIRHFFERGHSNFHVPVPPTADCRDVLSKTLGVIQLGKGHVETEPQTPNLRHDVHEVGLALVRDIELEHLLVDVGV